MSGKKTPSKLTTDILGHETEIERLIFYLQHDVNDLPDDERNKYALTPMQEEKLKRLIAVQTLIIEHKSIPKVARMHVKIYDKSLATAYRDINMAAKVFGPVQKVTKELHRMIADEMIMEDRRMIIQRKQVKSLPAATKNYMILHGLDKEDAEIPDLSDFEPRINIIGYFPEMVGVDPKPSKALLEERFKDFIDISAEDISFDDKESK